MPKHVIREHIGQSKVMLEYDHDKIVAAAVEKFNNYTVGGQHIPGVKDERVERFANSIINNLKNPANRESAAKAFGNEIREILVKQGGKFLGCTSDKVGFHAQKRAGILVLNITRAIDKELSNQRIKS